jgi:2-dehydro-3-deoxyglucarate aldolase/4-hydroxy-2-oxoheptanedioate aldolase
VEELEAAMRSTLYPPLGTRGFGPVRAVRYGLDDADEYIKRSNAELVRCVQIESKACIDNLAEMAENPYVDCFILGPCDLSGSIGELNQVFGENTSRLIDKAVQILNAAGKPLGVSTGSSEPEIHRYWHDKGIRVISAGTDYIHILQGSINVLKSLRTIQST